MTTNQVVTWGATMVALPTMGWLILSAVASTANDARQDASISMIMTSMQEAREEDRAWKTSISTDINRLANSADGGFTKVTETLEEISRDFYELRGTFNSFEFERIP